MLCSTTGRKEADKPWFDVGLKINRVRMSISWDEVMSPNDYTLADILTGAFQPCELTHFSLACIIFSRTPGFKEVSWL
jgi:hypothetical protein